MRILEGQVKTDRQLRKAANKYEEGERREIANTQKSKNNENP